MTTIIKLLRHLAACPLLPQHHRMADDAPLFGMNDWHLTVGDIRAAQKIIRQLNRLSLGDRPPPRSSRRTPAGTGEAR